MTNGQVENEKACAILSYFLVGIIWYFADEKMKQSSLAKYHAKQGLVLLIASIAYSIILGIIFSVLITPFLFRGVGGVLSGGFSVLYSILGLLNWVPAVFAVIGIINAAAGREKPMPIIGKFGEKFTF